MHKKYTNICVACSIITLSIAALLFATMLDCHNPKTAVIESTLVRHMTQVLIGTGHVGRVLDAGTDRYRERR